MTMKLLFPMSLVGAAIGGLPGGLVAFFFVARIGISGLAGEAFCFVANLFLSLCGAFAGMLVAKAIRGQPRIQLSEIIVPVFLGVVCGIASYLWLEALTPFDL